MNSFKNLSEQDSYFLSKENYHDAIIRILSKLNSRRHYLHKSDFGGSNLKTILENEDLYYESVIKYFQTSQFQADPFKKIKIVTNKERDIYLSTWSERILFMMAQNAISKEVEKILIPNVFSFRKGFGPFPARDKLLRFIKENGNDLYLFQGDIKSYGDNINQDILLDFLQKDLKIKKDSILYQVVENSIRIQFQENERNKTLEKGIPSGSPLVPVLENLYLNSFDHRIGQIPGIFYARYGDDFLFLHKQKEKIDEGVKILEEELQNLKLEVKEEKRVFTFLTNKTHLKGIPFKKNFQWIGFSFHSHGEGQVKKNHFKEAKAALHKEINLYFKKASQISSLSQEEIMAGTPNALRQIYGQNELVKRLLKSTTDQDFISLFISNEIKFVKRMIQYYFKLNSRAAWKITRKINLNIEYFL